MSGENLGDLVREIRQASLNFERTDSALGKRMDGFEKSLNELHLKSNRPGGYVADADEVAECKDAVEFCKTRRGITISKIEVQEWTPSAAEVSEALNAQRSLKALLRYGNLD